MGSSMTVNPSASMAASVQTLVIVNLQRTPHDHKATLRINGKCEDVSRMLMEELKLQFPRFILYRRAVLESAPVLATEPEPEAAPGVLELLARMRAEQPAMGVNRLTEAINEAAASGGLPGEVERLTPKLLRRMLARLDAGALWRSLTVRGVDEQGVPFSLLSSVCFQSEHPLRVFTPAAAGHACAAPCALLDPTAASRMHWVARRRVCTVRPPTRPPHTDCMLGSERPLPVPCEVNCTRSYILRSTNV